MRMSIEAASPKLSATVTASAGSGKTWLLVSRMVRLLLHGAEPGSILALTFTRKAAGEMQARLTERLRDLALADDAKLIKLLEELGEDNSADSCHRARLLYEKCLLTDYPVRTMTFHSFCQDILSRFPVEANLPPDFELVESTALLIEQSLQQLYSEATIEPDGELAHHLEVLLEHCQSIDSTKTALKSFIDHRSDWWAYTEDQSNNTEFAIEQLQQQLKVDADTDPAAQLFSRDLPRKLERFRELHLQIATDKQMVHAETIALVQELQDQPEKAFAMLIPAFMTQKMEPQKRKESAKSKKILGDSDANEYVELHFEIAEQILDINDLLARQKTLERNIAWFNAASHLLDLFQTLKSQLHNLDFTDLEWRTYQLLKHSENAEWVQYKLDQRINHLLIDEFQDTNPTQWHLLKPLLEELASGEVERQRSVFIVGDEKQSIYGFRRANPELQAHVADWLEQQIGATKWPLNKSWRSSPAVINLVNAIFRPEEGELLADFPEHGTHKTELPGKIVVKSLFPAPDKSDLPEPTYFRNPLVEARNIPRNQQYIAEAQWIAEKIQEIVSKGLLIEKENGAEPVQYDDIYILLKNRTHVSQLEQVLRKQHIPFISANRNTLLNSLEIRDMEVLLEVLIAPFNDLALAQVLKSPIFSATDDQLLELASVTEYRRWFKKMQHLNDSLDAQHPIARAFHFLNKWRKVTDRIPVHDLLDIIFYDTNLLNRYQAAAPDSIKAQVKANLQSFLELALDIDSGRYPSVTHFLNKLRSLKKLPGDAPDEASANSGQARVNIMTVHAAKGLEAPVVFMADTASQSSPKLAHNTMVNWPTSRSKPDAFHLMGVKTSWDNVSKNFVKKAADFQAREDLNLLYVALTRAKQFLFISGSEPNRKIQSSSPSWYALASQGISNLTAAEVNDETSSYTEGEIKYEAASPENKTIEPEIEIPAALSQKIFETEETDSISPSFSESGEHKTGTSGSDEDARTRGTVIHRALELFTDASNADDEQILLQIKIESGHLLTTEEYDACLQEAKAVIATPEFNYLFEPSQFDKHFNELPIHYRAGKKDIHGIIDRVVIKDETVFLVDYKTHQTASKADLAKLADEYQKQMDFYKSGLEKVWPEQTIRSLLLFTHCKEVFEFEFE